MADKDHRFPSFARIAHCWRGPFLGITCEKSCLKFLKKGFFLRFCFRYALVGDKVSAKIIENNHMVVENKCDAVIIWIKFGLLVQFVLIYD